MPNLNDAIKEAYEYAPGDITYYDTLKFHHSSFISDILIVRSYKEFKTKQGTFIPVHFEFSLPESTSNVTGELQITLFAVSIEERLKIRKVVGSRDVMEITYCQYIEENTDPDLDFALPMQTTSIVENDIKIEIKAVLSDLNTMTFPKKIMTTQLLPGTL